MNLEYAIFRSEPIYTINDLAQIGSHNKREKQAYNSNPDIDLERTKDNIELVPLFDKYVKGYYELTKDYRKEHDERMKTEREDRKRTFKQMLDRSNNVVADELLFTATNTFFKDMGKEDIKKWADTCMEFVYKDLGYKKEQILHATVHMDEKTPHVHCVVVPLIKKFDKRTNTERYTMSKKQFIRDKLHISELQDKYHKRLVDKGYDLERGIKGSDRKHIKIKDFKKINRQLEQKINVRNDRLDKIMNDFDEQMKESKNAIFDKEYVKVKKETFETMNKVIKESKKIKELEPRIKQVFNEIDGYASGYKHLEKENQRYKKEISKLESDNEQLIDKNNRLIRRIEAILDGIKRFFRKLLQIGNEHTKEVVTEEVKDYYDYEDFTTEDIKDIAIGTEKEDELFEYANVPDYYKSDDYHNDEKDKDYYDFSR